MPRVFLRLPGREVGAEVLSTLRTDPAASQPYALRNDILIADLSAEELESVQKRGARIYSDVQFEILGDSGAYLKVPTFVGLPDVLDQIRAPDAWQHSRGEGVTIAVVDTGVCPTLLELPPGKRSRVDLSNCTYKGSHWDDPIGHGSMCATIAAGTSAAGGRFDGVAPDSQVIAARSTLRSTDLYMIFDELITLKRSGTIQGPLVISNSYGIHGCNPSTDLPEDHPYLEVVLEAIDEGISVVFAAGNSHWERCGHDPTAGAPNSIWGVNSHERVISIGTVNRSGTNCDPATPHPNSSRGPGQWSGAHPKPDCVAPTYGDIVWGSFYTTEDWWGTSGACAQVAGLAALLLSLRPDLSPEDVASTIRSSCRGLPLPPECVGHGIIDCVEALNKVR